MFKNYILWGGTKMQRNMLYEIKDIDREIEEAKKDILWSDNPETIAILQEKIERLEKEKENLLSQISE